LASVADQLQPPQREFGQAGPSRPNTTRPTNQAISGHPNVISRPPNQAVTGPHNAATRRPSDGPPALPPCGAQANTRVVSQPLPAAIVNVARHPQEYEEDVPTDTRKRKRVSQPAPHHITSRTPNTRIVLRKGKDDYAFNIVTKNAYPNAHERLVAARAAHDVALKSMSDATAQASAVDWSPSKLRLYGDTGWV